MLFRVALLILVIAFFSCKQSSSYSEKNNSNLGSTETVVQNVKDSFETGKVINAISCVTNTAQSFALYLPKGYTTTNTYPVIYFFDAHGSGRLPLDNYFKLADEYNFILVGSNDSKNGMQPEVSLAIANNLITDVKNRLSINTTRQYVAGFSGGARVAGMVALQTTEIAGVIVCSAGINSVSDASIPFCVVGIAGNEDFNRNELVALDKQLDKTTTPHQLLLFNGKHEWCPSSTMNDAFIFLETAAMRNKTAAINALLLNNFKSITEKEANRLVATNKLTDAAATYQKLIHYLNLLVDVKSYEQSLATIEQNKLYQSELAKAEQLAMQETQLKKHYMSSFGKGNTWWENEVAKINAEVKRQGNSNESFMLKRVLGSLSLASYMQANSALNTNELDKATYVLELYRIIDPKNSEAWFMSAQVHARQNNINLSLQELQTAIDNKFNERERMLNEPAFSTFANSPEFISLLNKIKN